MELEYQMTFRNTCKPNKIHEYFEAAEERNVIQIEMCCYFDIFRLSTLNQKRGFHNLPTILENILSLILKKFLKFESNTTSDLRNQSMYPIRTCVVFKFIKSGRICHWHIFQQYLVNTTPARSSFLQRVVRPCVGIWRLFNVKSQVSSKEIDMLRHHIAQ